jgi:PAS domain-containing protein
MSGPASVDEVLGSAAAHGFCASAEAHPDQRRRSCISAPLSGRKRCISNLEAERKNCSRFRIEIFGVPNDLSAARPHVLYIGRDITARKAAESAAAGERGQYRAVFNATPTSLVLRERSFRVVDVNPAYEAISGRKRAEVIARRALR